MDSTAFDIHPPPTDLYLEFDAGRWASADDVFRHIIAFKHPVYEAVLQEFRPYEGQA